MNENCDNTRMRDAPETCATRNDDLCVIVQLKMTDRAAYDRYRAKGFATPGV
jgi:hypothetical protein